MECVITVRFAIQINAKIYRFQRAIWKWRLRALKELYKERQKNYEENEIIGYQN